MRWAALAVGVLVVFSLLWIGGEMHRQNCVRDDNVSCSVLPWDNGQDPPCPAPCVRIKPLVVKP